MGWLVGRSPNAPAFCPGHDISPARLAAGAHGPSEAESQEPNFPPGCSEGPRVEPGCPAGVWGEGLQGGRGAAESEPGGGCCKSRTSLGGGRSSNACGRSRCPALLHSGAQSSSRSSCGRRKPSCPSVLCPGGPSSAPPQPPEQPGEQVRAGCQPRARSRPVRSPGSEEYKVVGGARGLWREAGGTAPGPGHLLHGNHGWALGLRRHGHPVGATVPREL
ncbi:uncharacterized protein [Vulpes vulpes]|uniref:Uncharacterized protein n=1 Tax=Vulpes vulpes TaxID=9627 RepID=A0ABM4YGZ3_VULVU